MCVGVITVINEKEYFFILENEIKIPKLKIILIYMNAYPSEIRECMNFDNEKMVKLTKEYSKISEDYILMDDYENRIVTEDYSIAEYLKFQMSTVLLVKRLEDCSIYFSIKKTRISKIKEYFSNYYNNFYGYFSYGEENKAKKD